MEDSPSQARVLQRLVEQKGFAVKVVGSRAEMLAHEGSVSLERYFLAVCDVNLPDAQDGEMVDWLLDREVPTIVYTSNASSELRDKMTARSVIDYVIKKDVDSLVQLANYCDDLWQNKALKVLVVDDTQSSLDIMTHLLKGQCFQVRTARTSEEALDIAPAFSPDLLVLDLVLPGNYDGVALTHEMRKRLTEKEFGIIGVSVRSQTGVYGQLYQGGSQ